MTDRFAALGIVVIFACKQPEGPTPPPVSGEWRDTFERPRLGNDYRATARTYRLVNGAVSTRGAKNRPLWLRKKLPRNVVVEFDAWSGSSEGDIKVELFGDGRSFDPDGGAYTSTGYVLVMGGWHNTKSIIARQDEHGPEQVSRTQPKVISGQRYRWRIMRQGDRIDWFVDDMSTPFLQYQDSQPLEGPGHAFMAFNNWQSDTWFDNLVIRPLPDDGSKAGGHKSVIRKRCTPTQIR